MYTNLLTHKVSSRLDSSPKLRMDLIVACQHLTSPKILLDKAAAMTESLCTLNSQVITPMSMILHCYFGTQYCPASEV